MKKIFYVLVVLISQVMCASEFAEDALDHATSHQKAKKFFQEMSPEDRQHLRAVAKDVTARHKFFDEYKPEEQEEVFSNTNEIVRREKKARALQEETDRLNTLQDDHYGEYNHIVEQFPEDPDADRGDDTSYPENLNADDRRKYDTLMEKLTPVQQKVDDVDSRLEELGKQVSEHNEAIVSLRSRNQKIETGFTKRMRDQFRSELAKAKAV